MTGLCKKNATLDESWASSPVIPQTVSYSLMIQDEKMTGGGAAANTEAGSLESGAALGSSGKTSSRKKAAAPSHKVARIRQALAEGSYNVSASDVADKLIDHMLDHRPPGGR